MLAALLTHSFVALGKVLHLFTTHAFIQIANSTTLSNSTWIQPEFLPVSTTTVPCSCLSYFHGRIQLAKCIKWGFVYAMWQNHVILHGWAKKSLIKWALTDVQGNNSHDLEHVYNQQYLVRYHPTCVTSRRKDTLKCFPVPIWHHQIIQCKQAFAFISSWPHFLLQGKMDKSAFLFFLHRMTGLALTWLWYHDHAYSYRAYAYRTHKSYVQYIRYIRTHIPNSSLHFIIISEIQHMYHKYIHMHEFVVLSTVYLWRRRYQLKWGHTVHSPKPSLRLPVSSSEMPYIASIRRRGSRFGSFKILGKFNRYMARTRICKPPFFLVFINFEKKKKPNEIKTTSVFFRLGSKVL